MYTKFGLEVWALPAHTECLPKFSPIGDAKFELDEAAGTRHYCMPPARSRSARRRHRSQLFGQNPPPAGYGDGGELSERARRVRNRWWD